jgi:cytidine deaminase
MAAVPRTVGEGIVTDIDWPRLRSAAIEAMHRAYAPYSRYKVGAAALATDGRLVTGCNVENASYGLTLCAECGLVSDLHRTGGGQLVAFVCVNGDEETIMPCGRCRQLLSEHALSGMVLATAAGTRTIEELLPDAFGPRDLDEIGR